MMWRQLVDRWVAGAGRTSLRPASGCTPIDPIHTVHFVCVFFFFFFFWPAGPHSWPWKLREISKSHITLCSPSAEVKHGVVNFLVSCLQTVPLQYSHQIYFTFSMFTKPSNKIWLYFVAFWQKLPNIQVQLHIQFKNSGNKHKQILNARDENHCK
jgi:hypothetical protein